MTQEPKSLSEEEKSNAEEAQERTRQNDASASNVNPAQRPEPTRYGDWEKDGRCIDF